MLKKKNQLLLIVGLAFLLAGSTACNSAPEKEEAATSDTDQAVPSAPTTATPSPTGELATGGAPATTAPPSNVPLAAAELPAVVAKVNGKPVTKEELLQAAQVVQMQLAQQRRSVAPSAMFYRQVLEELIAISLLQQDAKAQGVVATNQEVQRKIDARKSVFPSEAAFKQALAQAGITEEMLRQQARDQLAVQKYVETKLGDAVVPEQASREFYDKNKAKIRSPEKLHLRHILVGVDAKASPADKQVARQKADGLLKRLQAGEDFAQLAMGNSDDTGSRLKGGDLDWIVKGQTVPQFEKAAFALAKPNELSTVVESPFGFHIIQLLERQPAGAVAYEKVKDRIAAMLKQKQTQQLVQARVRELRAKSKVEVFI